MMAHSYRNIVIAQEGAFGMCLLARDICRPSLLFGAAGRFEAEMVGEEPGPRLELAEA